MPQAITEARALVVTEAPSTDGMGGGRFEVQLINPGWGSSGYYGASVLKEAARSKVFPAGTHMMVNHQTASENYERPEGDLKDLAAVLTEDAYWNGSALVAEARVFTGYRTMLTEMADDIGVSIRATAEVKQGEAEGRKGMIVERLIEGISVDYVTRAGRGGRILSVLESAREATTHDRNDQIQRALPGRSYVRDHDPDSLTVYFEQYDEASGKSTIYSQTYEVAADDKSVTLTGDPVEVRVVTQYLPVSQQAASEAPAPQSPPAPAVEAIQPTPLTGGTPMAEIADAELTQLRESAGQADTLRARAEEAEKRLAERDLRDAATARAREAVKDLHPAMADRVVRSVVTDLPVKEGALDVPAFDVKVTEAVKAEQDYAAAFAPAGGVVGFGASAAVTTESAGGSRPNPWGSSTVKGA